MVIFPGGSRALLPIASKFSAIFGEIGRDLSVQRLSSTKGSKGESKLSVCTRFEKTQGKHQITD